MRQEAVATAALQAAPSRPASLPLAFSAPSPCVLFPLLQSVATTQLPACLPRTPTSDPLSSVSPSHFSNQLLGGSDYIRDQYKSL